MSIAECVAGEPTPPNGKLCGNSMAARIRKIRHDDETRSKIQSSQLVNALMNHVLGENDMTTTQVSAALGLLRKTLPDLSMTELTGGGDINITVHGGLPELPGDGAKPVAQITHLKVIEGTKV